MEAQDVIRRLCELQEKVGSVIGHRHAADCFCGEGGFWKCDDYDGTSGGGYRNEGVALEFIERATRRALRRRRLIGMPKAWLLRLVDKAYWEWGLR